MKYVVIVGDGMADWPVKELGGKTPLQRAATPHMDRLASEGVVGKVRTVPEGMHPGSDVANLSILGYDPRKYYSGRAPLEAASIGVDLEEGDVAYRCNLVTLRYNREMTQAIMEDYSSGHISTEEAKVLIGEMDRVFGSDVVRFYPGVSYRHLMVWKNGSADAECVPPHDITGKEIADYLPVGKGEDILRKIMLDSVDMLDNHPVNRQRVKDGKRPANSVWLWGQGRKPRLPLFREKYGIEGALISAVDLTRGLGMCAGFRILRVPGMTGYLDTNYRGKADATIEALREVDFVYLHVEAPDEAGHSGNVYDKIRAIEDFDSLVVARVVEGMKSFPEYRILVLPDHPTPVSIKTHSDDPVPFALFDNSRPRKNEGALFNEDLLVRNDLMVFEEGYRLMDYLITGKS